MLEKDPDCTIATWGIASIMMNNPLAGQGASPKGAEVAQAAIDEGRRIGAKTQRERDYLEAVAAYYEDFATARSARGRRAARRHTRRSPRSTRTTTRRRSSTRCTSRARSRRPTRPTPRTSRPRAILEPQFAKHPDHPGVAHYLIHSYDAPPIAKKGLVAARRYATIAPDAPHALHMPSHIFTRVGAWEDSIATNRRSAQIAQ